MKVRLDAVAFWRNGSVVICVASAIHFIQATLMLIYSAGANPSAVIALRKWAAFGIVPVSVPWLIGIMYLSAALALYGTLFRVGHARLALFILQQWLLAIMGWGGIYAAMHGAYLDGTVIAPPHIVSDQLAYAGWFPIHAWAVGFRSRHA